MVQATRREDEAAGPLTAVQATTPAGAAGDAPGSDGDAGPATLAELRQLAQVLYGLGRELKQLNLKDPVDNATLAVLWRVHEHGEIRPSEVAAELHLDLSTISRHVRTLDQGGYLARTADPADRRACRLTATAAGQELLAAAWERRLAAVTATVSDWSAQDCRTLTTLLTRLSDALTHPHPPVPAARDTPTELSEPDAHRA
jgi:DNA-binding MarR family transcriptional regulator